MCTFYPSRYPQPLPGAQFPCECLCLQLDTSTKIRPWPQIPADATRRVCSRYREMTLDDPGNHERPHTRGLSTGRYWETVQRLKINQFYGAPTAIRLLLKYGDQWVEKYDRSTLKTLGTGRENCSSTGLPASPVPSDCAHTLVCVQWGSPSTLKRGSGITEWLEMAAAQWWTPGGKLVTSTQT